MRFLGFDIQRVRRQVVPVQKRVEGLQPVEGRGRGGWFTLFSGGVVRESYPGAWQQNVVARVEDVLAHAAVYACITLIASDIGKLRVKLVKKNKHGIWEEIENSAHSPVLRKPNHYQNRIKFYEMWIVSKLVHGNTYVLKLRDNRGVVTGLYVLDPTRVWPLVAPDASVYYELKRDNLSGLQEENIVIPAKEIIHDVMVPLYHPLVGVSPIYACGVSAMQGLRIQANSANFFANGSQPGGVLTAPGNIPQDKADELKMRWEEAFSGDNAGRVAVMGDGLQYKNLGLSAVDSQLIDQLKWTAENACTAFRVPPYMIGVTTPPQYANVEALTTQYYTQCLQNHIECIELLLDEGLEMPKSDGEQLGTEMDLDDLLRMDTPTKIKAASDGIKGGGMAPNEARLRYLDLGPVAGGDAPYLQQQNYSLEALAKRDAQADPFGKSTPTPPQPNGDDADKPDKDEDEADELDEDEAEKRLAATITRAWGL